MSWRHLPLGHSGTFGTVGANTWRSKVFIIMFHAFFCRSRHERGWTNISFCSRSCPTENLVPSCLSCKAMWVVTRIVATSSTSQGTPFGSHQREQCRWVLWEGWHEVMFDPLCLLFSWADSQRHTVGTCWNMDQTQKIQGYCLSGIGEVNWHMLFVRLHKWNLWGGKAIYQSCSCLQSNQKEYRVRWNIHKSYITWKLFLENVKKTSWQIVLFGIISETNITQLLQGNGIPVPDDVATAKLRRASKIFLNLFESFDDLNSTDCISRCPK